MVVNDEFVTVAAVAVKFVLVAPAATVTDAGTRAASTLLLVSATVMPPPGAAELNDTVPVDCPWLFTEDWLSDTADSAGDPGVGAGLGADGVEGATGVGVGDDGVPLPQLVNEITKLAASEHITTRCSTL